MSGVKLKTNFAVENRFEAFYTGGKVQFTKDGKHMFCQCGTKVCVVDVTSGKTIQDIEKEGDEEVSCFVLSPDNQALVVASRNLMLRQWNWQQKDVLKSWKSINTAPISCMSFDLSSTLLACGSADSTVKVYDVIKQYYTHNLRQHQGVVTAVEFHPDEQVLQLFTAAEDYKIRVWSLQTSKCLATMDSHFSTITCLVFDSKGHTLYSAGRDKVVIVWDAEDFSKKKTLPVYESVESLVLLEEKLEKLNVRDSGHHFITAGSKGILQLWQASSGRCVYSSSDVVVGTDTQQEEGNCRLIVQAMSVPALSAVCVITFDHNIILYDNTDLSLKKQFVGNNDDVLDIKFLGKNDSHIAVATNSELVKVYELATWSCQVLRGHTDIVLTLDVHKCGMLLATGSKDSRVLVWQLDEDSGLLTCMARGLGHIHDVGSIAFSRLNASFMVSGSVDLTIKVWTLPNQLMTRESETEGLVNLDVRVTVKAHDKDINSLAVSPNDKILATGSQDRTAKLWRLTDLGLVGVFRGHKKGVWCVNFSPVDQCLVTAAGDATIKIWALADFSCVKTFEGHESSVLKVHFMARGMQLLSSGSDGLLKLWTIKTSECVATLDEHEARVWALAINKAEDSLVTGSGDSSILLWKDMTQKQLEEKLAEQEKHILLEQRLSNLLKEKKYLKAIGLAITLHQPFKVLNVMKEILGNSAGKEELAGTVCKLREDQIDAVLGFAVEWNTNSRHCHVAQNLVSILLRHFNPDQLKNLPNVKSSLEGLLPYTDRHYQRMGRLLQQATFVDYTWESMKLVDKGRTGIIEEGTSKKTGYMYLEDRAGSSNTTNSLSDSDQSCARSNSNRGDENIMATVSKMEIDSVEEETSEEEESDTDMLIAKDISTGGGGKEMRNVMMHVEDSSEEEESDKSSLDDHYSNDPLFNDAEVSRVLQLETTSQSTNLSSEEDTSATVSMVSKRLKASGNSMDLCFSTSEYSDPENMPTPHKGSDASPAKTLKTTRTTPVVSAKTRNASPVMSTKTRNASPGVSPKLRNAIHEQSVNTKCETVSPKTTNASTTQLHKTQHQIHVDNPLENGKEEEEFLPVSQKSPFTDIKKKLRPRTPVKNVVTCSSSPAVSSPRRSGRINTQEKGLGTPMIENLRVKKTPNTDPAKQSSKRHLELMTPKMSQQTRRRKLST